MRASGTVGEGRPIRLDMAGQPRRSGVLGHPARRFHTTGDAVLAALLSITILVVYVAMAPSRALSWFLAPALLCGVLIGPDMVAWLRGRFDLFDPLGLLGAFGYYFFFLAPLLMVFDDYHSRIPQPRDWLAWVGWAATLNVGAILVYRTGRSIMLRPVAQPAPWLTNRGLLLRATVFAVPLTLGVAVYTLAGFGGLSGLVDAYSERNQAVFSGLGMQFLVGESFPNVLAMMLLVWKRKLFRENGWALLALVVGFFALRLVFGGLRGSRSNTVWALIWLGGAIHLWIRPLRRRVVAAAVVAIMAFVYVYGFYKAQGRTALERLGSTGGFGEVQRSSGRTLTTTLVGDLSRAEIQAVLVARIWEAPGYRIGLGSTYLDSASILLPKSLRGDRTESKIAKGTEAIFGQGTYAAQSFQASYVYGLLGEAMLNFHVVLAPLAFLVLAAWVSLARNTMFALHPDDVRRLVHPIWIVSCVTLLAGDSDNVIVFLLRTGAVPIAFVWLASRRVSQAPDRAQASTHP